MTGIHDAHTAPAAGRHWPWALVVARLIVGGLFLFAAVGKFGNPTVFAGAIDGFRLLHPSVTLEFALLLIWLELICGALLVLGVWARAAALLICAMLAAFFLALASAVVRGFEIDCGCFGALMGGEVGPLALLRTLVLLALAALVFWRGPGHCPLGRFLKP